MDFGRNIIELELIWRFYPSSLTNKNEIPVKIVKELVTDGYAVMLISTVN